MANIKEVTDFSDPQLDIYARLTEVQLLNRREPDKGIFIAESPKVIERALNAGCVPISFLMETRHVENQAKQLIARCGDIPVFTAELDVLTQLTGFKLTRGMLCAMYRPKLPTVEDICKNARRVAVLEDVMNPTNVGAIFRSAAALGIDAVVLTSAWSSWLRVSCCMAASRSRASTRYSCWARCLPHSCFPNGPKARKLPLSSPLWA